MRQRIIIFCLTTMLLFAFGSFNMLHSAIQKRPYLIYTGVNTEMKVNWQTTAGETCTLEWGLNTSYSLGSTSIGPDGSDNRYRQVITGLTPGTKYYYRVKVGSSNYTGSFRSGPPTNAQNVKFFAYGDTRSYPADQNNVTGQMIDTYTSDPEFQTLACHVADWVDSDSESDWTNEWFNTGYANNMKFFSEVPIMGSRGNHEGSGSVLAKYFRFPYYSDRFYYAFEYGPTLQIFMDTEDSHGSGSAQYNWLVSQLQNTSKKWIFITLHAPGFSAGTHSNNSTVANDIQPLCVQYGVEIVFGGHNHNYARILKSGIQHITTGGGGASLYSVNTSTSDLQAWAKQYHHCEIEIQGDTMNVTVRNSSGSVIDAFSKVDNTIPTGVTADFSASSTIVAPGANVTFTDQSTGGPTSWSWSFPGGTPSGSTAQNPTVTYAAAGTYNVTLTATNSQGSDVETKTNYITVSVNPTTYNLTTAVTGEGTVSPSSGSFLDGTVVNIEAVPSNGYVFNGWSGALSGSTNPTTITMDADKNVTAAFGFSSGGDYLPFPIASSSNDAEEDESDKSMYLDSSDLEMVDESGSSSNRQLVGLRFTGLTIPGGANITGAYIQFTCDDDNTGSTSLTIKAEDTDNSSAFTTSSGNISNRTTTSASVSWSPPAWSTIGEAGAAQRTADISSLIQEVIDRPGYSSGNPITIIITGSGEREAEAYDGTAAPVLHIRAEEPVFQPPTANFSANQTTIDEGQAVNFTDLSTDAPTSWSWAFAGGTPATSSVQNPSVTYNSAGTYDVTLTVSNSYGSDTKNQFGMITVNTVQPPTASFTGTPTTLDEGQSVSFTDSSTNNPTSWSWTFTGGTPSSSTVQNPTVTYNTAGTYSVTLTASNSGGSDSTTRNGYITVNIPTVTYCTSSAGNQSYEYIENVTVGNLNYNSGSSGYSDFTAQTATLSAGASVSVSVTPKFLQGAYTEYVKIWIDWNKDGDFADSGEEVFSASNNGIITGSFTVPSGASGTTTRMRVSMRYNSAPPSCGTFSDGEVEDYTVNVQ